MLANLYKVILKVEGEGTLGQTAKELSSAELNQLRSLISVGLGKLSNHTLVSSDEKDDAVGLLIAAEKLQCGRETYYLVSSVVTLSKAKGTEEFVTHNVFAEPNLEVAAKAVVAQLAMIELRIGMGLR